MSDLVRRLRDSAALPTGLYAEAATEIERLTKERNHWEEEARRYCANSDHWREQLAAATKERDAFQDQCIKLKNERAVEREQLAAVTKDRDEWKTVASGTTCYVPPEFQEQLASCQKDAARYRWLRDQELPVIQECYHQHPDRFDEAIDAAMKEQRT